MNFACLLRKHAAFGDDSVSILHCLRQYARLSWVYVVGLSQVGEPPKGCVLNHTNKQQQRDALILERLAFQGTYLIGKLSASSETRAFWSRIVLEGNGKTGGKKKKKTIVLAPEGFLAFFDSRKLEA